MGLMQFRPELRYCACGMPLASWHGDKCPMCVNDALRSRDPKDDGWWPPLSGERDEFGEVTE